METETHETPVKKAKSETTGNVNITLEQFQLLMSTLISESRKPVHDPMKEKQKARMREHNQEAIRNKKEYLLRKFHSCNHMQLGPYAGCCAIAWAQQSDGRVRGACQHCGTFFSPVADECLSPEIHEAYKHLIRIQTHPAGNLAYGA
jgi:hypothetical protein